MTRFELDENLLNQIQNAMENQEEYHLLDSETLLLVRAASVEEDPDRYIALPIWTSIQGFSLMESFVIGLHNPLMRHRLHSILKSGRGVFRQFKDTLRERPDIERLWHRFKEKEMRKTVLAWYNEYRELWGLEQILDEGREEDEAPILGDFSVKTVIFSELDSDLKNWVLAQDKILFLERYKDKVLGEYEYGIKNIPPQEDDLVLIAETVQDEKVGFVLCKLLQLSDGLIRAQLVQLWVEPHFRGLGLGKYLLSTAKSSLLEKKANSIYISYPADSPWIYNFLQKEGFESTTIHMVLER